MHRLGFPIETAHKIYQTLNRNPQINTAIWLMSHLACADDLDNGYTAIQLALFQQYTHDIQAPRSLAHSAAIMAWPEAHMDWVRPGLMLYGVSPLLKTTAQQYDLKAVMHFYAPIIAIHYFQKGDSLGYGSIWDMP